MEKPKKVRPVQLEVGDKVEYTGFTRTKCNLDRTLGASLKAGDVAVVIEVRPPVPSTGIVIEDEIEDFIDPGSDGRATVRFSNGFDDLSVSQDSLDKGYFKKIPQAKR